MSNQRTGKAPKGYKGIAMEGVLAKWYAGNQKKMMGQYKGWAKQVSEDLADGSAVLEVAPGPGYLAIELARLGHYEITGLDISKTFVEVAQKNANEAGVNIDFRQGDAGLMPFGDETFDFIVCTAAFKNFAEPLNALNEVNRVLRANGRALIIDLKRDLSKESIEEQVNEMHLGRVNSLFTKWTFNWLAKRARTKDEFTELVSKTAFGTCTIQEEALGLEIRLQKQKA